ncbi:hypothetical protein BC835DRAFT_767671 [Cytidiella melzeri]|nr:hypothetical protein BC835DRAFT_767671 [Cytidiella melzeri]
MVKCKLITKIQRLTYVRLRTVTVMARTVTLFNLVALLLPSCLPSGQYCHQQTMPQPCAALSDLVAATQAYVEAIARLKKLLTLGATSKRKVLLLR